MTTKLYDEERGTDGYDNLVMKHMMAMTSEDLHGKAAIAVELAYRDKQIAQLREALQLAKVMMQANDLYLPKTLDVIDKALEETR